MNDDIKEILEYWKFYINEPSNYKLLNVHFDEIKKVLDYITNLQQENEDYKSRLEKAVKYYKRHQQECVIGRNRDGKLIKDYYLPAQHSKVLLNILQNKRIKGE